LAGALHPVRSKAQGVPGRVQSGECIVQS
jgi:hypothetical protein